MVSCFAHDKNHWINLLEVELPSCSLEAASTLTVGTCRRSFMRKEWLTHSWNQQLVDPPLKCRGCKSQNYPRTAHRDFNENESHHTCFYKWINLTTSPFQAFRCCSKTWHLTALELQMVLTRPFFSLVLSFLHFPREKGNVLHLVSGNKELESPPMLCYRSQNQKPGNSLNFNSTVFKVWCFFKEKNYVSFS